MKHFVVQLLKLNVITVILVYVLLPWNTSYDVTSLCEPQSKSDAVETLPVSRHLFSAGINLKSPEEQNTNDTTHDKIILLWNRWYMWPDYRFGLGSEPFREKCGLSSCTTTTNRSLFQEAHVVVFFATLVTFNQLPQRENPDQVWVFMDCEPAAPTYGLINNFGLNINMTITYRSDSTIHWPYGVYEPRDHPEFSDELISKRVAAKTRPVAWMASRCGMNSNNIRLMYINELSTYIEVDIYGKCGNHSCDKDNSTRCMEFIEQRYKFYLAFENSVCRDYVTEKAFRTLKYDIVPIVMGGGNYSAILPPNSYIDVVDYTPRELAEHLHHLDSHAEEYMEYLAWKRRYVVRDVIPDSTMPFCRLCDLVNSRRPLLSDFNVSKWWEGDSCVRGWIPLMKYFHLR